MATSNSLWLDVVDNPPSENVGWEVKCRPLNNLLYNWIENPPFISMSFRKALSEEGEGSIEFDLDSYLFTQPLSNGADPKVLIDQTNLWEFYQDGVMRFQFLGENITEKLADDNATRVVKISGPGIGRALSWAKVMPVGFPNVKVPPKGLTASQLQKWFTMNPSFYRFRNTPIMSDWLTLLWDAQKRGTIPFINWMFTRTVDSAGVKWADTKPPPKLVLERKTESLSGFAEGSAGLSTFMRSEIDYILSRIPGSKPGINLVGHTDIAESSSLGISRANNVKGYILGKRSGAIVTTESRGNTKPVNYEDTASGKALNRRVDITYTAEDLYKYTQEFIPSVGVDLYNLLQFVTGNDENEPATLYLDWIIRPPRKGETRFLLDVRPTIGTHRENSVRFYESHSITTKDRIRKRDDIVNYLGVRDVIGGVSFATLRNSINQFSQREDLISKEEFRYAPARQRATNAYVRASGKEKKSWTLAVAPYIDGRKVFIDYDVGDWIGIESQDIVSPTLKVHQFYDEFEPTSLDLTKWEVTGQAAGEVTILPGGGLHLRGPEATKWARIITKDEYNFWNSGVAIQIDSMIGPGNGEAEFKLARYDAVSFSWRSNGSVIQAFSSQPANEGGSLIKHFEAPWNPVDFKHVRMNHRASTNEVVWESSRDGKTWVYRARRKVSHLEWWNYKILLETGDDTDPVASGSFNVRRVNTQAGATSGLMEIDRTAGYGTEVHRVIAIAGQVDENGRLGLELQLESSLDIAAKRTARIVKKLDKTKWQNALPGGVEIQSGTYGSIKNTEQIVTMGTGSPQLRGVGEPEATGYTDSTFQPSIEKGSRLRWNEELGTWVPAPNVWVQDDEPEGALPYDMWTPATEVEE
jgi:hypothetical protein